ARRARGRSGGGRCRARNLPVERRSRRVLRSVWRMLRTAEARAGLRPRQRVGTQPAGPARMNGTHDRPLRSTVTGGLRELLSRLAAWGVPRAKSLYAAVGAWL